MRVLVSDASVLIEVSRYSLVEAMFRLPYEFAVLWLIDQLAEQGLVPRATLIETLQAMRLDPRTHLPHAEIDRRLRAFALGDG